MCGLRRILILASLIVTLIVESALPQVKPVLTLSAGYGQSYGGAGVFGQWHPIPELGLHTGIGIFSPSEDELDDVILGELGIRLYPTLKTDPIYLFIDFQFGGLGVESHGELKWNGYNWSYSREQQTLIGPSLLTGGEVRLKMEDNYSFGFGGALGLSYILNDIDWINNSIILTLELGLHFYFTQPPSFLEH